MQLLKPKKVFLSFNFFFLYTDLEKPEEGGKQWERKRKEKASLFFPLEL
jgi:hypothetical protein